MPHTQHIHTGGGGGGGSDIIEVFLRRWMAWWRRANERRRHLSLIWINASDSSCSASHYRVRLYISSVGQKAGAAAATTVRVNKIVEEIDFFVYLTI